MKRKYIMAAVMLLTCGSLFGCGKTSEDTKNAEMQGKPAEVASAEETAPQKETASVENADRQEAVSSGDTDTETVYSPYGDIGQLGEEGYYYNADYPGDEAYEVPIFETTADITHDGIEDLVSVVGYSADSGATVQDVLSNSSYGCYVKLYRGTGDGEYESYPRFISRNFHLSHAGNGTICISHKENQDYLLISVTYEMQGTAQYDFAVFYVDDEQGIVIEDGYGVEFAVDAEEHTDWAECVHREDVVPSLQERMAPYLEDSLLLLSLNIDNGAFYSGNGQMMEGDYFFQQIWDRE